MRYFVSLESTHYYHWQIELLIESFEMLGLGGDLCIAVAQNDAPADPAYTRNLSAHANKFFHPRSPPGLGKLDKLHGLAVAIKEGMLGDEFCVLHPDMVLYRPVDISGDYNVLYEARGEPDDEKNSEVRSLMLGEMRTPWFPLGEAMLFKGMESKFFARVLRYMEKLVEDFGGEWKYERAAWMCGMVDHIRSGGDIKAAGTILEMPLVLFDDRAFLVHYKHGMPPVFSKQHFKNPSVTLADRSDPYEALMAANPTPASNHVQKVVQSYRSRHV